jgi:thioester reductase-like protein
MSFPDDLTLAPSFRFSSDTPKGKLPHNPSILITGATGFVGVHLISYLLNFNPRAKLYCLVRCANNEEGIHRIMNSFKEYFLVLPSHFVSQISIIPGDFASFPNSREYFTLTNVIDVVFHLAADTDYIISYEKLRPVWIEGLISLVNFCITGKLKALHWVGSIGSWIFEKEEFHDKVNWWYNGYLRYKIVARKYLLRCFEAGLPGCVYEPPYILGPIKTGKDPGFHYTLWRLIDLWVKTGVIYDFGKICVFFVDKLVELMVKNTFGFYDQVYTYLRPFHPEFAEYSTMKKLYEVFGKDLKVVPVQQALQIYQEYSGRKSAVFENQALVDVSANLPINPIFPRNYFSGNLPPLDNFVILGYTQALLGKNDPKPHFKEKMTENHTENPCVLSRPFTDEVIDIIIQGISANPLYTRLKSKNSGPSTETPRSKL